MSTQKNRLSKQLATKRPRQQDEITEPRSVADTFRKPENPLDAHINVRTTTEFRDEVKLYCVQAGISLQDLVGDALEEYMQRNPINR